MPHPKKGYFASDGKRIPGTTTIIGRFKESGGLIHWAWDLGMQGINYRDVRDKAADTGTWAHEFVEASISGIDPRPLLNEYTIMDKDKAATAWSAFQAYLSWEQQSKLEIIEQEMQLVSEIYRFGGTPDAIGEINGELCLLDWKTSNRVYQDYLIQLAAYKHLWEVNNPDRPLTGGFHLCRFAKEHGDFSHHYFPRLDEAWEQFKLFRKAYDIDKDLKKRAT